MHILKLFYEVSNYEIADVNTNRDIKNTLKCISNRAENYTPIQIFLKHSYSRLMTINGLGLFFHFEQDCEHVFV